MTINWLPVETKSSGYTGDLALARSASSCGTFLLEWTTQRPEPMLFLFGKNKRVVAHGIFTSVEKAKERAEQIKKNLLG